MQKVRKAVIPAAGLGTRMLPLSRCVPKEMFPIVDKPAVHYLVREAIESGITDILIITGRDKDAMEDYFDYSPEYEAVLREKGRGDEVEEMHAEFAGANIFFVRQKEKHGLGHAISIAKSFVAGEPFCVLYGDDIVFSEKPVCLQMIESYVKYGRPVAGVRHVPLADISKYCSMKAEGIDGSDKEFFVTDMIEKPKPEQVYTDLAILGRVLLSSDIFDILEHTAPGRGGEIQLTDAMAEYARNCGGMTGLVFEGERFDMGSKLGFITANIRKGLEHPEIGEEFKKFIIETAENLK